MADDEIAAIMQSPEFRRGDTSAVERYERLQQQRWGFGEISSDTGTPEPALSADLQAIKRQWEWEQSQRKDIEPTNPATGEPSEPGANDPEQQEGMRASRAEFGDAVVEKLQNAAAVLDHAMKGDRDLVETIMFDKELGNSVSMVYALNLLVEGSRIAAADLSEDDLRRQAQEAVSVLRSNWGAEFDTKIRQAKAVYDRLVRTNPEVVSWAGRLPVEKQIKLIDAAARIGAKL